MAWPRCVTVGHGRSADSAAQGILRDPGGGGGAVEDSPAPPPLEVKDAK